MCPFSFYYITLASNQCMLLPACCHGVLALLLGFVSLHYYNRCHKTQSYEDLATASSSIKPRLVRMLFIVKETNGLI